MGLMDRKCIDFLNNIGQIPSDLFCDSGEFDISICDLDDSQVDGLIRNLYERPLNSVLDSLVMFKDFFPMPVSGLINGNVFQLYNQGSGEKNKLYCLLMENKVIMLKNNCSGVRYSMIEKVGDLFFSLKTNGFGDDAKDGLEFKILKTDGVSSCSITESYGKDQGSYRKVFNRLGFINNVPNYKRKLGGESLFYSSKKVDCFVTQGSDLSDCSFFDSEIIYVWGNGENGVKGLPYMIILNNMPINTDDKILSKIRLFVLDSSNNYVCLDENFKVIFHSCSFDYIMELVKFGNISYKHSLNFKNMVSNGVSISSDFKLIAGALNDTKKNAKKK